MLERKQNLVVEKFRQYLLPTILMTMSVSIALVLDSIIVGNLLGSEQLASVNLVTPLSLGFSALFAMIGVGGSTLMAVAKGARDEMRASRILTQSSLMLACGSLAFPVAACFFLPQIVRGLTSQPELVDFVSNYAAVLLYGAPLLIFVSGFSFFIRSDGNPQFASKILVYSNIVNLVMDIVYIRVFGMNIGGAALATLTGYLVGAFMIVAYLWRKNHQLVFARITEIKPAEMLEIPAAGISSTLGQVFLFVKMLAINHIVLATLGTPGMVAFSVCLSCLSLVSMFISGATQTMMPIVGVMFGEKDWQGIRFTVLPALKFIFRSNLLLVAVFLLLPRQILALYGVTEESSVVIGVEALRWFAPSLLGVSFSFLMIYYNQTVNRKWFSVLITSVQGLAVIPFALMLAPIWGGIGIWSSFILAEIFSAILIYVVAIIVRRRYPGHYETIFLFEKHEDFSVLDVTIFSDADNAVNLSRQISDFAMKHGVNKRDAMFVGLAAEEMAMHTITNCYKNAEARPIDVMTRVDDHEIILRFRDGGAAFNPTKCLDEEREDCSNIFLLHKIASKIDYARIIGLNSTIVTIPRSKQE